VDEPLVEDPPEVEDPEVDEPLVEDPPEVEDPEVDEPLVEDPPEDDELDEEAGPSPVEFASQAQLL